jgi:expansin (peptidoglycan-binding protein)
MRFSLVFIIFFSAITVAQIDYDTGFVKGRITFYSQSPAVACDIPESEWPQYTAALSEKHFQNGLACGATANIKNGSKEIQVMIVDLCPKQGNEQWCSGDLPHFDLGGATAFSQLENIDVGVKEVQIQFVPTPVGDTPVKLHLKDGINAYWFAIQVLNHRYPVSKLEIQDPKTGSWITGQRKADLWNYWVFTFTGTGLMIPYQIRITDQYGQVIEETGNSLQEKFIWSGTHQFPIYSGKVALSPHEGPNLAQNNNASRFPFIIANNLHYDASLSSDVAIMNVAGRKIAEMAVASGKSRIKLPTLPGSVYYVRVANNQTVSWLRWACVR